MEYDPLKERCSWIRCLVLFTTLYRIYEFFRSQEFVGSVARCTGILSGG